MLLKSHPEAVLPALAVLLVALVAIFAVPKSDSPTGGAIMNIVEVRQYQTFANRLCPDPAKPIPVLGGPDIGGSSKSHVVACISRNGAISRNTGTFEARGAKRFRYSPSYATQD